MLLADKPLQQIAAAYLQAYRAQRPLSLASLAYYQVMRCIIALVDGAEGQQVWRQPSIRDDLVAAIEHTTGVRMTPP